jgi:hypothetical protein
VSGTVARKPWPSTTVPAGTVEYKRERRRGPREATSYVVSTPDGLLLGRVYSEVDGTQHGRRWFAEGWRPETEDWRFGAFGARWQAMDALVLIESRGVWPLAEHTHRIAASRERQP